MTQLSNAEKKLTGPLCHRATSLGERIVSLVSGRRSFSPSGSEKITWAKDEGQKAQHDSGNEVGR